MSRRAASPSRHTHFNSFARTSSDNFVPLGIKLGSYFFPKHTSDQYVYSGEGPNFFIRMQN